MVALGGINRRDMEQLMRQLEEQQVKLASWGMNRAFLLKTCCLLATKEGGGGDKLRWLTRWPAWRTRGCVCVGSQVSPPAQPPSSVYVQGEYLSEIM